MAAVLRQETVGGALLVIAAAVALVWANASADSYETVRDLRVGPGAVHLNLSLADWAADGLLAVFFFVAGLELKREFVAGDLRDRRTAALPVVAALGGMIVPAAVFLAINSLAPTGDNAGWAIPSATDIAFALAVLAVISRHLPDALRTFLLTLAVVDDLLAIVIIALFFSVGLNLIALAGAAVAIAVFGFFVQRRLRAWWLLIPLAAVAWALMHESGVHATVAGVLLAFTVPVAVGDQDDAEARAGMAERLEHRLRPLSAGIAVPIFALLSAGVVVGGLSGVADSLSDPVAIGVVAGLVVGKVVGIVGAAALVSRWSRAQLDDDLNWADVVGVGLLAGIGFTVSLLIGDLAYGPASERTDHVKVAILVGSTVSAALAAGVLAQRNRVYRPLDAGSEAQRAQPDP